MPFKNKEDYNAYMCEYRKRKKAESVKVTEWAYLAGLIDGDGTISLTKHGNRVHPSLQVYISNTSKELMDWLEYTFPNMGSVYTVNRANREHIKRLYVFRFRCPTTEKVLREISPYLVRKKKQSQLALAFFANKDWRQGQRKPLSPIIKQIWERISLLNQRGVYHTV